MALPILVGLMSRQHFESQGIAPNQLNFNTFHFILTLL